MTKGEDRTISSDRLPRKLAGIFFADARGYSRLMHIDESGTAASLRHHVEHLIAPRIARHGGRLVKTMGDGLLADFGSVVDALHCGVDVQRAIHGRNIDVPQERRIEFRIGINLGDVIVQGGDLFGDGVNVAARLQAIAEPGSIYITRAVYDQVQHKVELAYEYVGARTLKNIPHPVEVFRIRPPAGAPPGRAARAARAANRRRSPLAPPDRPSIAVLPLANTSGNRSVEVFCDGLTDGIITNLSKFRELFVIARHSSFAYKDRTMAAGEVARELGVRYLLEGSVLTTGGKVRVTLRLIDASTGYSLWGGQYDRGLEDVLQVQDDVTRIIVGALPVRLEEAERSRIRMADPADLRAYGYLLKGKECFLEFTKPAHARAHAFFRKAIECDPGFSQAYAWLSRIHNHRCRYSWTNEPEKALREALKLANKAVQLDPTDPRGYSELGIVHLYMKNVRLAIAQFQKALELNPNDADIMAELADALVYDGRGEEALELLNAAMRLNPFPPDDYYWKLADAYYVLRDYEAVIRTSQRMLNPSECDRLVAASYAQLGRLDEARAHAAEVMRKHPDFRISAWARHQPDTDPAEIEHFCEGLRKAGLPE